MRRLSYFQKAAREPVPGATVPLPHARLRRWELTNIHDPLDEETTAINQPPAQRDNAQPAVGHPAPQAYAAAPFIRPSTNKTETASTTLDERLVKSDDASATKSSQAHGEPASSNQVARLATERSLKADATLPQKSVPNGADRTSNAPAMTTAERQAGDLYTGADIEIASTNPALSRDASRQAEATADESTRAASKRLLNQEKELSAHLESKSSGAPRNLAAVEEASREGRPGASANSTDEGNEGEAEAETTRRERHARVVLTPHLTPPVPGPPARTSDSSIHIGAVNVQVTPPPPTPASTSQNAPRRLAPQRPATTLSRGLTSIFGLRQG